MPHDLRLVAALGDGVPSIDPAAKARARDALDALIAAERSRVRPRRRLVRWAAVAAAAAIVLVAVQAVLPWRGGRPTPAAASLRALAAVAATAAAHPLAEGAYAYERSTVTQRHAVELVGAGTVTVIETATYETWTSPDGSGRIRATAPSIAFASADDERRWREAGSPALPASEGRDDRLGPGALDVHRYEDLPADPDALADLVDSRSVVAGPPGPLVSLDQIADLLRGASAPAAHRAALFEVAARLPGVVDDGVVTDDVGRRGVGVSVDDGARRLQLIFDPATSELLAERTSELLPGGDERVLQSVTYLEEGIVRSVDEVP